MHIIFLAAAKYSFKILGFIKINLSASLAGTMKLHTFILIKKILKWYELFMKTFGKFLSPKWFRYVRFSMRMLKSFSNIKDYELKKENGMEKNPNFTFANKYAKAGYGNNPIKATTRSYNSTKNKKTLDNTKDNKKSPYKKQIEYKRKGSIKAGLFSFEGVASSKTEIPNIFINGITDEFKKLTELGSKDGLLDFLKGTVSGVSNSINKVKDLINNFKKVQDFLKKQDEMLKELEQQDKKNALKEKDREAKQDNKKHNEVAKLNDYQQDIEDNFQSPNQKNIELKEPVMICFLVESEWIDSICWEPKGDKRIWGVMHASLKNGKTYSSRRLRPKKLMDAVKTSKLFPRRIYLNNGRYYNGGAGNGLWLYAEKRGWKKGNKGVLE